MLETLAVIWALLLSVGTGVDVLFMRHHRRVAIHRWLSRRWERLSRTSIPDLPRLTAGILLALLRRLMTFRVTEESDQTSILPLRVSPIAFAVCLFYSIVTNLVMMVLSRFVIGYRDIEAALVALFVVEQNRYVAVAYAIPNIALDLVTVAITCHVLAILALKRSETTIFPLLFDLFAAILLAVAVFAVADAATSTLAGNPWTPIEELRHAWGSFVWLVFGESPGGVPYHRGVIYLALGVTTFFPTIGVLVSLIFLTALKLILIVLRYILLDILGGAKERTPENLLPATMLCASVALALTFAHLVVTGWEVIHQRIVA